MLVVASIVVVAPFAKVVVASVVAVEWAFIAEELACVVARTVAMVDRKATEVGSSKGWAVVADRQATGSSWVSREPLCDQLLDEY